MAGRVPTPRLAFISHHFRQNDGQGRVNYEVVKAALEAGSKVTVLAISCDADLARHCNCNFVQIGSDSLPTELLRNLVFARASAKWLRRNRSQVDVVLANGFVTWEPCDLVSAHFVHAAWYKSSWYPFKKIAPYALYQWLYTVLNVRWEKQAFLRAKRVIAVSKNLVNELVDIGVAREKIEVVINGIDIEQFHSRLLPARLLALPPGMLALFVGDLKTPRKNLEAVLAALQRVPDLSLAITGDLRKKPLSRLGAKAWRRQSCLLPRQSFPDGGPHAIGRYVCLPFALRALWPGGSGSNGVRNARHCLGLLRRGRVCKGGRPRSRGPK